MYCSFASARETGGRPGPSTPQLGDRRGWPCSCISAVARASTTKASTWHLRQLSLTEEQVRGFLSLGKPEQQPPVAQPLSRIVSEVDRLVAPAARHGHVVWECEPPAADDDPTVTNAHSVRAGLLNLVLNAVQAAGSGGRRNAGAAAARNRPAAADASACRRSGPDAICRFTSPIRAAVRPSRCARQCSSLLSRPSRKASASGSHWRRRLPKSTAASLTFARFDGQTRFTMSLAAERPRACATTEREMISFHRGRRRLAPWREPSRGRELRARLT